MFLLFSLVLLFQIPWVHVIDPYLTDVDIYGQGLAANEHLVVSIIDRLYSRIAVYRPYYSDEFCKINMNFLTSNRTYIMRVAVPRNGSGASNQFFFEGLQINNAIQQHAVLGVVSVSLKPCRWLSYDVVHLKEPTDYSLLGISTFGDLYLYTDDDFTYVRDIIGGRSSMAQARPLPDGSNFIPYAMDVAYDEWGVIAGTVLADNDTYVPTLYLITFPSSVTVGSHNYVVLDTWTVPFEFSWQRRVARTVDAQDDFNVYYAMSVSINNLGDILFGVQSMNTVFQLYVDPTNATFFLFRGSRIYSTTIVSIGFGKSVAWLDDTTAVILANNISLDYTTWESSRIEIYDLSNGQVLSNTLKPYSSFPSTQQRFFSVLTGRILVMTASYASSIIFMDSAGHIYVVLPSTIGYYTATHIGNTFGSDVYFSSAELCPEGSATRDDAYGKNLFTTCKLCPVGTYRSYATDLNAGCIHCNGTLYFCSLGAVAEVPISYLDKISQATTFPESSDLAGFEDILLFNMFNMNFKGYCLLTTPLIWVLAMLSVTLILLTIIGLLTLIKKCENFRRTIESSFKHFDIINDGDRWISGILSLSIFIIIIFAALFTHSFLQQYPSETSRGSGFTCDETIRNSQFSSQMQSLGTPIPKGIQTIYNLLNSQQFLLTVTLLNTNVDTNVTVTQVVGTRVTRLQRRLSVSTSGCLVISCNLTSNIATVVLNISSFQTIGGARIGLSAPSIINGKNLAKEITFANSFSVTNRIMSQQPYFSIELIQVINETKPLVVSDNSDYSGIWIPTYNQDSDRNFYTENDYELYHIQPYTLFTVDIQQGTYYIYNLEKPIIRTTAVIFKNFLFASMCMEIIGFILLIFKLAIMPLIRFIIRRIRPKENKAEEENEDDSDDEDEEEDSESDYDIPQIVRFGRGENQWYIPDDKI